MFKYGTASCSASGLGDGEPKFRTRHRTVVEPPKFLRTACEVAEAREVCEGKLRLVFFVLDLHQPLASFCHIHCRRQHTIVKAFQLE